MADKKMNEFTPATDANYIYGELADGNQIKLPLSDLLSSILGSREKIDIRVRDGGGASLLDPNAGIVFAYDSTNSDNYLFYGYLRKDSASYATRFVISSNGVTLGAQNNMGTSVAIGADTQICLCISV